MGKNFTWQLRPEDGFERFWKKELGALLYARLRAMAQRYAARLEAYMKTNASWQDRTGNLRASLYVEVEDLLLQSARLIITIDYGLTYGKYVAAVRQGQFDIIGPTLDVFGRRIFRAVQYHIRQAAQGR